MATVEVAHRLVWLDGEAQCIFVVARGGHIAYVVIGEADEFLFGGAIEAKIAVGRVAILLNLLLRLKALVVPVPNHEVHFVFGKGLIGCSGGTGARGAGTFFRGAFVFVRVLFLFRFVNAEEQAVQILRPQGSAIGADRHAGGKILYAGRIEGGLLRAVCAKLLEPDDGIELVFVCFVVDSLKNREAVAIFRPSHVGINGVVVRFNGVSRSIGDIA